MRIEAGVATDIGKVREANEDSYLVEPPLFAVADGMGGHRGGDVASQLALATVEQLFRRGKGTLSEHMRQANRAVFERSQLDRRVTGMGTTLTAALVEGDAVHLAHVGDSRAYLLRAGALRQLTTDHTLVARMVKAGEISPAEAEVHPHRNVLTRALGTEPDVRVDEDDVPLLDGDRVLLCSDGLTGMVTEEQIQAILESAATPQEAANRLVRAANRAGGVDNITVVVLGAGDEEARSPTAPGARDGRRRWPPGWTVRRGLLRLGVAVVVLAAIAFGARAYLDRQWYVGVENTHVAVYQGIPATPLGVHLSSPVYESAVLADDATALPYYAGIRSGLAAKDRNDAFAIVEQIRADVAAANASSKVSGP
jgi:serine/threonine protein phosphatase PrpC